VAPVPLADYQRYMTAYRAAASSAVTRDDVRAAFSDLVVSDRVIDRVGPAVNTGHSLFVYGPPGNGKTVMSLAIHTLLEGEIAIPSAIEVEGHIIRVFDPVKHQPVAEDNQAESLAAGSSVDRRWVRCRRPLVTLGAELTLESLDLRHDSATGLYHAPVQAVANGGVLVIDDFGRQRCSPVDLLNRWIVPLESRIDFLTLPTGQSFELPFTALIVFATNLQPSTLVDEALLRRIPYKVLAQSPSADEFRQIFRNCCRRQDVVCDDAVLDELLDDFYRPRGIALRGCHPRDLIAQVLSLADYLGEPRRVTSPLLQSVCAGYFLEEAESAPSYA